MIREDLTQTALDAMQPATKKQTTLSNHNEASSLRGKILGLVIRKSRLQAERSIADCALYVDVEPGLVQDWEYGESEPSLPQLELLARFLSGEESLTGGGALREDRTAQGEYALIRQRLIGALLRAARQSSGKTVEALSESAELDGARLQRFELGEEKIPVSILIALAQALQLDMSYFTLAQDMPKPASMGHILETAPEPSSEWREFASDNENLPFIQLAMAFQSLARDDLHRIADALFAIIRANGDTKGWPNPPT